MSRLRIIGSIFLLGVMACVYPATGRSAEQPVFETAEDAVAAMIARQGQHAYSGTRVVWLLGGEEKLVCRMRVFYSPPSNRRIETLCPKPIENLVVLMNASGTWRSKEFESLPQPFALAVPPKVDRVSDLELLRRNYRLEIVGTELMAGRQALIISIAPKRPHRPSQRVWLDQEHAFPLRFERLTAEGVLDMAVQFDEIHFGGDFAPDMFTPKPGENLVSTGEKPGRTETTVAEAAKLFNFPILTPSRVPEDFVLQSTAIVEAKNGEKSLHLGYTDGLATISAFQENPTERSVRGRQDEGFVPLNFGEQTFLKKSLGPLNILRNHNPKSHVTILGNISTEELADMLSSMTQPSSVK